MMSSVPEIEAGSLPPWSEVQRYDVAIPRYTSYPTVPAWQPMDAIQGRVGLERAHSDHPVSVYVHMPFCARMCLYCGCNSVVVKGSEPIEAYAGTLQAELNLVRGIIGARPLVQLHFGGGTPTYGPPKVVEALTQAFFTAFPPRAGAEVSIEIDPVVTTAQHFASLQRLGFNRVSLGVQDFDEHVQEIVQRRQSAETSRGAMRLAREHGFEQVNIDLMYGLPGQTPESTARAAMQAVELGADRVAVFGYAHVPKLRPHQRRLEIFGLPGPAERWDMLRAMHHTLTRAGYVAIGIDHFAKPDDELVRARDDGRLWRNFQGYTVLGPVDLVGFGASAISDVGGVYLQNNHRLSAYRTAIDRGELATERGFLRSPDDEIRRFVIIQLMCHLRLPFARVEQRYHIRFSDYFATELATLDELARDGLVERTAQGIDVTPKGRPLARYIAARFDAYLAPSRPGATAPQFSRAI